MKRLILFTTATILSNVSSFATIRTVSNSPSTVIGQFSNIQAAVNASSSGDSVYVHGSPVNYSGFTITDKRLVIIGPGWSPDKAWAFTARVSTSMITGPLSARTEIQGVTFIGEIFANTNRPDSLRFIRNLFTGTVNINQHGITYRNYIFQGNFFSNIPVHASPYNKYENCVFQNNVFYSNGSSSVNNLTHSESTVLFDHNLWYGPGGGSADLFGNPIFANTGPCQYLLFTNNIFVRRNAANHGAFNTFNNNITFLCVNDSPWTVNDNIDNGENVSGQDPQMVDQSSVNGGSNNPLLNFTISTGPADGTGTDDEDMGLLYQTTGSLNWTNSRNSRLPRVYSMNIANSTVQVNGTLTVNVEGRKSN